LTLFSRQSRESRKHLAACAKRKAVIEKAEKSKGASESLYHLRVQDMGARTFGLI